MLLSCPNCGTVTKVADVLIPSARLIATCAGCGGKIGGTVPARLDGGRRGESGGKRRGPMAGGRERRAAAGRRSRAVGGGEKAARAPVEGRRPSAGEKTTPGRRSGRGGGSRNKAPVEEKSCRPAGGDGTASLERGPRRGATDGGASSDGQRAAADATGLAPGRKSLRAVRAGLDAERLAKLVASDLLLYNREKIRRTSTEGSLLSSMATELVEAWDYYRNRVGANTALGTSYFRDALNAIASDEGPLI